MVVSSFSSSHGIITRCESSMLEEVSNLIAADSIQLQLNINTYLNKVEGNVALMFSDEAYYGYDKTTTDLDEYDMIQVENAITDRIVDLGSLENYGDFCVVYADSSTVGWKSKTTGSMYSNGDMYEDLSSYINRERTQDGWAFGVKDNLDRMYYVKRYNPNAIIVASFYTRELDKVFDYPDELQGMIVRLVDTNGVIIYSSDKSELGQVIEEDQVKYLDARVDNNAITDSSIINASFCENGWMVMTIMPKSIAMADFEVMKKYTYIFAIIVAFITILVGVGALKRLSKPMDGYVDQLSEAATVDALSKVYNRAAFEEEVTIGLKNDKFADSAFIMFDIDNFKKVNDTLGHDYGDEVIKKMGKLLSKWFDSSDELTNVVGRLGGDEFAVFAQYVDETKRSVIIGILDEILVAFKEEFQEECKNLPLSLSIGVAFLKDVNSESYRDMYIDADSALYISKESGKDQYNIYKGDMSDEA